MRQFAPLLCALAALAACSKPKPAPAPVPPPVVQQPVVVKPPAPVKAAPPPKLTSDQMTRLDADFKRAETLVVEADRLLAEGKALLTKSGPEAANDTFVKAKKKYQEVMAITEPWVEEEMHEVTAAQINAYLRDYTNKVNRWQKAMGQIPKLHD